MFLLLNQKDSIELGKGVLRSIFVRDLFHMSQGVPMTMKSKASKADDERYAVVQVSDLSIVNKGEDAIELQEINLDKTISSEKFVQVDDYLLTCKGYAIKGLAVKEVHFSQYSRVIANSHLIVLRPLTNNYLSMHQYYIPFIHFLMDKFIETYNESSTKHFITIKELGSKLLIEELNFSQLDEFGKLYSNHAKLQKKLNESNKLMSQFYTNLRNK